jgi:ferritin-like metal-binding protein YciE
MSGELACDDPRNNLQNGRRAMGFFTTPIKTMDDLYKHQLQDIYYAEKQITKGLTEMIAKANNASVKQAFQKHLGETEQQIKRLDEAFRMLGQEPKGTTCPAIDGIISEARELISDCGDPDVCDAAMIAAAQAVEHYEITRYGALIAWARELGHGEDATILARNLREEKAADNTLTAIADRRVNPRSARRAGRRAGAGASHPRRAKAKAQRTAASRRKPAQKKKKAARRRS